MTRSMAWRLRRLRPDREPGRGLPPAPGLPICIAENVKLQRDIRKDEKIYLDDVDFDPRSFNFDLFQRAVQLPARIR